MALKKNSKRFQRLMLFCQTTRKERDMTCMVTSELRKFSVVQKPISMKCLKTWDLGGSGTSSNKFLEVEVLAPEDLVTKLVIHSDLALDSAVDEERDVIYSMMWSLV